jgi:hypothetical protein
MLFEFPETFKSEEYADKHGFWNGNGRTAATEYQ